MKRWLNIPIFIFVLLTVSSLGAEEDKNSDKGLKDIYKADYQDFSEIKIIDKRFTLVSLMGDAKDKGLNKKELTDHLIHGIKNNFTDITIEEPDFDKYTEEQVGLIYLRVWFLGDSNPMVFHVNCEFWNNSFNDNYQLWNRGMLGFGSLVSVNNSVKESIDELIQDLAVQFYKGRGKSMTTGIAAGLRKPHKRGY